MAEQTDEQKHLRVKAVLFDVDGTLVDSVDAHARAWQEAFKYFGKDIAFEDVRGQIGKGGDQLMPVFFSEAELEAFGKEMEEYRGEHFKQNYLPQVKGFPMVRELFERIEADGKKIALASSAKGDELRAYKKKAGILDMENDATTADDVDKSKPEPDIFEAAMKELDGISTNKVIVVGDTPYDAIAAKRAGLQTVGVLCGGFPEQQLRDAGCIAIYKDPADLLANYESSPLAG